MRAARPGGASSAARPGGASSAASTAPQLLDLRHVAWGLGTAAFQVEGGAEEGGKEPSIWDVFCAQEGKIADKVTGAVTCDQYHRYKEDVQLLAQLKVKYYRFSLSWPRLIAHAGSPARSLNPAGAAYYNALIDELIANGITPVVTLYHWDLPCNGHIDGSFWLQTDCSGVVDEFLFFADQCFSLFGDRVKVWTTFNEPRTFVMCGYAWPVHAPGIVALETGVWRVGHNVLLAHAAAVQLYRTKFKAQGGRISINLNCDWAEPATNTHADKTAAKIALKFFLAWFADPIFLGDYPKTMKKLLGSRLPSFTAQEKKLLKGSADFFALNHYTTFWAGHMSSGDIGPDSVVFWHHSQMDGQNPIGPPSASDWLKVVPWGFRKLLKWVHERYKQPEIWITENGVSGPGEEKMSDEEAVNDTFRVEFFRSYLTEMDKAMKIDGVNVSTYIAWSLMDNFEWNMGFVERFGVVRVNLYGDKPEELQRSIKKSATLLQEVFVDGTATAATNSDQP